MKFYLGVDGGQSSTTALIADESGRVLGFGRGGPCNHVGAVEGRAKFVHAITGCVGAACERAGLAIGSVRFASACLGFSGGPADKEAILHEILASDRITVTHDGLIALAGATAGEPGIIVIAGTGSFAFGRNRERRSARAGGWGFAFGDEGGGFDLTRHALRASLRYEEGWGPPTLLRRMLLDAAEATDANDLLHRFYTTEFPRARIASFSKLVDNAACAGDVTAIDILNRAARELAAIGGAVHGQLFQGGGTVPVAYIGGVFRSALLLDRFRTCMQSNAGVRVAPPVYGPAAGALIEAYRVAGVDCALSEVPEMEK